MVKIPIQQTDPPLPPWETLPTMYDLPSEDPNEPGLPDEFHDYQPELLRKTFSPSNYERERVFCGSDLNLYYNVQETSWYKRPDWFAVVGVDRFYRKQDLRRSYVVWQEEANPFIVVELLSPSTLKEDLGQTKRETSQAPTKWEVYEQILRIPYYFTFDGKSNQLKAFQLVGGHYRELELSESGVLIKELGIGLGIWQGNYEGIERHWLRWYDKQGNWIVTESEIAQKEYQRAERESQRAERESQRAERESQRAERESQRAKRLAERLRQAGINPEEI